MKYTYSLNKNRRNNIFFETGSSDKIIYFNKNIVNLFEYKMRKQKNHINYFNDEKVLDRNMNFMKYIFVKINYFIMFNNIQCI